MFRFEADEALGIFVDFFGPFVRERFESEYNGDFEKQLIAALNLDQKYGETGITRIFDDEQKVIKLILNRWHLFERDLHYKDDIRKLKSYRDAYHHREETFTYEKTRTLIDLVQRLVRCITTADSDDRLDQLKDEMYKKRHKLTRSRFSPTIERYNNELKKLNCRQLKVVKELLVDIRKARISGCAGSGKTLLAAEIAIRLREALHSTLILCHNPAVADYHRELTKDTGVDVEDFTTWVRKINEAVDNPNSTWTHYEEPTEEEVVAAFSRLGGNGEYSAVIVDEAQDFRSDWWVLVEAALKDERTGILYIFHDDNQALLPGRCEYPPVDREYRLPENIRNAKEIFQVIARFHERPPEHSVAILGEYQLKRYEDGSDGIELIGQSIFELLDSPLNLSPDQIVVLTTEPDPINNSKLYKKHFSKPKAFNWQDEVLRHLDQLRKNRRVNSPNLPDLSENCFPTEEDKRAVQNFAKQFLPVDIPPQRPRPTRGNWLLKDNRFRLSFGTLMPNRAEFFSGDWTQGMPKPKIPQICLVPSKPQKSKPKNSVTYIQLQTVSYFKGLEASAVVLYAPFLTGNQRETLYVATSRAKFTLHVVASHEVAYEVRELEAYHYTE